MATRALPIGACSAAIAVLLGAFGAHALKGYLPVDLLQVFETGVRYQMYHAIGLIAAGVLLSIPSPFHRNYLLLSAWLFLIGSVVFSGSLYALALTGSHAFGAATPLGGIAFIGGWLMLGIGAVPNRKGSG